MSRIKARALSEQGSYDSERSLTHSGFMDEADKYCDENSEGKGQFTGNRSCKRCKGEQLIRAYCLGKKNEGKSKSPTDDVIKSKSKHYN